MLIVREIIQFQRNIHKPYLKEEQDYQTLCLVLAHETEKLIFPLLHSSSSLRGLDPSTAACVMFSIYWENISKSRENLHGENKLMGYLCAASNVSG